MRQLSTRDQMTQKLTTIGHRTTFNNEESPYCIVSYKRQMLLVAVCYICFSSIAFAKIQAVGFIFCHPYAFNSLLRGIG